MYKLSFTAEKLEELFAKHSSDIASEVALGADSYITVNVNFTIANGSEIKFKAPAHCSNVVGLRVNYKDGHDIAYKDFIFADAHRNNVGNITQLFVEDTVVKVILDVSAGMAFVQNADTNTYLEDRINSVDLKLQQTLSPAEKAQIRSNIDAIASDELTSLIPTKVSELSNDAGYLTSVPAEYITETELNAKGYLTEHQNLDGYAKTADLGTLASKNTVAKTDLSSDVQTSLGKADTALQSYTETDPTVPSWAKASSKPTYTKSEVGLGNVDNVKQYSANNPPPYPVTSVNGATGAVTVKAVPACSASNNGQFLRVVNGVAAWSTVPNAEEAEF